MTNQEAASDEQFVVVEANSQDATKQEPSKPNDTDNTDQSAANGAATTTAIEIPPEIFLKGLTILSPRQTKSSKDHHSPPHESSNVAATLAVPLPPLRPEEPVASLRSAISEVIGFAHLTKYRLVLEEITTTTSSSSTATAGGGTNKKNSKNKNSNGASTTKKNSNGGGGSSSSTSQHGEHKEWEADNVVSTYTLDGAELATDKLVQSLKLGRAPEVVIGQEAVAAVGDANGEEKELELDDYGDLSILLDVLEKKGKVGDPVDNKIIIDASNFAIRVVLERYDVASIRDHMVRVRQLFEGNAPHLVTLKGEEDVKEEKKDQIAKKDEGDNGGDDKEKGMNGEESKEKAKQIELPNYPSDYDLSFGEQIKSGDLSTFFYLACGDEQSVIGGKGNNVGRKNGAGSKSTDDSWMDNNNGKENKKSKANKKKSKGNKNKSDGGAAVSNGASGAGVMKGNPSFVEAERSLYELNEATCIQCTVRHSGYHPPPANRRTLGDLAYIECTLPGGSTVHITAFPRGFYVNRSTSSSFNPAPAKEACYSQTLLDCLLQHSKPLREAWLIALTASKNRADLIRETSMAEDSITSLLRSAVSLFPNNNSGTAIGGPMTPAPSTFSPRIDSVVQTPSWLVPLPSTNEGTWEHGKMHGSNANRTEEDLMSTFGVEMKLGGMRDWNEEIQAAREMPTDTLQERLERAKFIHKIMSEFGDAALLGVKAIFDGFITPMNTHEPSRSHVYLHNNIFFSRAIDIGMDTFKTYKGDNAARKSASRDATNINLLHRLDMPGLHTLGMVLVEYMGVRFVCQSVIPGILHGEKSHTLAYGTIDARNPLKRDDEIHELAEELFGEICMVATRSVPTTPLTDERMEALKNSQVYQIQEEKKDDQTEEAGKKTVEICGPIEMKAILGSDKRKYLLDCTRLTPRDANWIGKESGGTGLLEADGKKHKTIPSSLDDDDWVTSVLRPELVANYAEMKVGEHRSKIIKEDEDLLKGESAATDDEPSTNDESESKAKRLADKIEKAEKEYMKTLKYNVNVFLPDMRPIQDLSKDAHEQLKKDEEEVRSIARYLWEIVLPKLTTAIRIGEEHGLTIPVEGGSLTDFIHQNGVNCRYLGRLAELAAEEETKDVADEKGAAKLPRQRMPLCWLELLECEMVARAAKHVLNSYMIEEGVPSAKLVASFLSAVVSTDEESASETELRMGKLHHSQVTLSDDDTNALVMSFDGVADPADERGRLEIWSDIEREVGRRFRYTLSFYGNAKSNESRARALYLPLLRRICQRSGIRLVGKRYDLGGKCLIGGSGRLTASYPIAPTDIVDILPLVKHGASVAGESFVPCSFNGGLGSVSLHILLNDVKMIYDAAHTRLSQGVELSIALEYLNETAALCQRVVETTFHPQIQKCFKLTATAYANSNDLDLALVAAEKCLTVSVALNGFDSSEAYNAHVAMADIYFSQGKIVEGMKHYRAVMFLGEAMAGPNYSLAALYFSVGRQYVEAGGHEDALRFYEVASKKRNQDRVIDGIIGRHYALALARLERFKEAFDCEKNTFNLYSAHYGEGHDRTKESAKYMNHFMTLAVQHGRLQQQKDKDNAKSSAADAIANQLLAAEDARTPNKNNKANKRRTK